MTIKLHVGLLLTTDTPSNAICRDAITRRRRDRPHYLNWQTEIRHALKTALENTMANNVVMYSHLSRTTSYPLKPQKCDMAGVDDL